MKNLLIKFLVFTGLILSSFNIQAQNCPTIDKGSVCVGECGMSDVLTTYVPNLPRGQFEIYRFCLEITENSLCPNHDATVSIYVNNNLVSGGLIPSTGAPTYSFWALDGSNIKVVLTAASNGQQVFCKRLGLVTAELKGEI